MLVPRSSLVEGASGSSLLSCNRSKTIPDCSENPFPGSTVLLRDRWHYNKEEDRFITAWQKEKRHIATSPSTKPNAVKSFATKTMEGNQLTSSFCLTWRLFSRISTKWISEALLSPSAVLGRVELNIPSVLLFGHSTCEQLNNIFQGIFSEYSGMSQLVHRDSLVVFDSVIWIKLKNF